MTIAQTQNTAEQLLRDAGIPYAHLDGSTRRRQDVIDSFKEGQQPVFLQGRLDLVGT